MTETPQYKFFFNSLTNVNQVQIFNRILESQMVTPGYLTATEYQQKMALIPRIWEFLKSVQPVEIWYRTS